MLSSSVLSLWKSGAEAAELPGISVIVPTFRRPALLQRCLKSLSSQTYDPARYEILVCDDGASSDTKAVVDAAAACSPAAVRYLPVAGSRGPAAARNLGARAAVNELLAFLDDDCIAAPSWLLSGAAAFAEPELGAAVGKLRVPLPAQPTDYELNEAKLEQAGFITANLFCRKDVFFRAGGFDPSFTMAWREDSDLYFKLLERDINIRTVAEALVWHPVRPAAWGVSIFQQRKIMFDALLYKKHPKLYRTLISQRPPLRYYAISAAFWFGAAAALSGWSSAALPLLALWLVLTLSFFLKRIPGTSRRAAHILELAVTSAAIPFLSVFWRLYGACKFRVIFM